MLDALHSTFAGAGEDNDYALCLVTMQFTDFRGASDQTRARDATSSHHGNTLWQQDR